MGIDFNEDMDAAFRHSAESLDEYIHLVEEHLGMMQTARGRIDKILKRSSQGEDSLLN